MSLSFKAWEGAANVLSLKSGNLPVIIVQEASASRSRVIGRTETMRLRAYFKLWLIALFCILCSSELFNFKGSEHEKLFTFILVSDGSFYADYKL